MTFNTLTYFGKLRISEISTKEIITWQNELLAYRDEKKKFKRNPIQVMLLSGVVEVAYQLAMRALPGIA